MSFYKGVYFFLFTRPLTSLSETSLFTRSKKQLGRGLRLHDDKECLTVLDFIGQAHKEYKFEDKFRALIGRSRHAIKHYVENGFSTLPRGSFIQLEKQAKDYVLRNIMTIKNSKQNILMKLENFTHHTSQKLTLVNFLEFYQLTAYDFYGRSGDRSFYRLLVETGLYNDFHYDREKDITKRLPYLLHINSEHLLSFYLRYLKDGEVRNQEEQFMLNMLYYTIFRKSPEKLEVDSIAEGLQEVLRSSEMKKEIQAIFTYNYQHLELVEKSHDLPFTTPLRVHCSYSTDQVLAALGYYNEERRTEFREGAIHLKDKKADVFFITLNKSDKDFSPSKMYDDYAMNEWLFHWQSQSRTSVTSETAKRYIHHRERNHQILLFVREYRQENGYAAPFTFLGTAEYVRHSGSKPVSFVWKLHEKMPAKLIVQANKHIL